MCVVVNSKDYSENGPELGDYVVNRYLLWHVLAFLRCNIAVMCWSFVQKGQE